MTSTSFTSISYSDPTVFIQGTNQVALKEYSDNILAYVPFDVNLNILYGQGVSTVVTTGNPVVTNFGEFAQCVNLAGSITYSNTNFNTLANQGCVKFWVKSTFNNGFGHQSFLATTISAFTAGTYGFALSIAGQTPVQISFPLLGTESFANIYSTISSNVSLYDAQTNPVAYMNGIIEIQSLNYGDTIAITAPSTGLNLITLLGGVGTSGLLNAPAFDATLFSIKGATNNNRIDLIHKATTSTIVLNMYDNSGNLIINNTLGIWNNSYLSFYSFELSFNSTMAQLFINGNLLGMCITGFTRQVQLDATFIMAWNGTDIYKFDELIVYKIYKNIQNYTPEATALTKYSTTTPYADVDFGVGFVNTSITAINIDASANTWYAVQLGNQFYYYMSGSWHIADGSYSQTINAALLESQIINFTTDPALDLSVRIYFESDGITPSYINSISIDVVPIDNSGIIVDGNLPSLDYSPIFDYVRSRLGAPIVPVELTDEQLQNLLAEVVTEYNRWRNYREELLYETLYPSPGGLGYTIPSVIGDPTVNIVDIIVKPAMPFGYYAADTDMASNLFMQYLFQKFGRPGQVGFLTDYWMALSTEKDMNLILGTEVRWEIIGNNLIITPTPHQSLQIGIRYRASLTVTEILSDNLIRRALVGLSKMLLGNIRGTFGGSIPGGTENIQLNSAELIRQGEAERDKAYEDMIKQAEPQQILIG